MAGPADCNENGVDDSQDIANLTSPDCDSNGVPDECQIDAGSGAAGGPFFCMAACDLDCNHTGIPDVCELSANDCNADGRPDECGVLITCDSTEDHELLPINVLGADLFGVDVSVSGNTALIGADSTASVFRFDGTSWNAEQQLTASNARNFGRSVSIHGDWALVGARDTDCADGSEACGAAFIFRCNQGF